jgi:signal transduction histidine kinase
VMLVRDTGIGIPAEHLDLIWERFHRIDPSRNRAGGGRGLGLAIVKQFVERMHGRVEARSVEHQGSTFEIRLPRA